MYTLINLERDIEKIIAELAEVRASKGHDYSGTADTLDNLRAFGWKGVVVRLGDKFHRLKHFILSGEDLLVKDESIEDTLQDFVNYALFSLILYRQEKAEQPCPKEGFALGRYDLGEEIPVSESVNRVAEAEAELERGLIEHAALTGKNPQRKTAKGIVDWENDIPGGEV